MNNRKVGILAECVCDLPKSILKKIGVDVFYFVVETENGVFTDTDEITAENVLFHMESGGSKTKSSPPPPEVYQKTFERSLKLYDEVILVAISSHISHSCDNAKAALEHMGSDRERVHIFDSHHLSSGLGFLVMKAAELADKGLSAGEILSELETMKSKVSTSFLTKNADYLYRNGLVSAAVKNICSALHIHPVLEMKNGHLKPKTIIFGSYEAAAKFYIRMQLKDNKNIDKKCAFITHAGCTVKTLRFISDEVKKYCTFEKLRTQDASATISSNCGPDTFGILFIKEGK